MCLPGEDVNIVLSKELQGRNFELVSCEKLDIAGDSVGFLSDQSKISIKYKSEGRVQELRVFAKKLPQLEYRRKAIIATGAFEKEAVVYEKFLNGLHEKLQDHCVPKCYLSRADDIIVLKDLSQEGFTNAPLLETLTYRQCTKVIDSLAKLHTQSIVLEQSEGCKVNQLIPLLNKETLFKREEDGALRLGILSGIDACLAIAARYLPKWNAEIMARVRKYMVELPTRMVPSTRYLNSFSHGDMWANNIMFSYDEGGEPKEACIVDFQISSYKPLTYDLHMLLHCCMDKESRDMHYKEFTDYYYKRLEELTASEGIVLADIVSASDYRGLLDETLPVILALTPQYLHFVLMPDHLLKETMADGEKYKEYYENRTPLTMRATEESPAYKQRIVNCLSDLFQYFNKYKQY